MKQSAAKTLGVAALGAAFAAVGAGAANAAPVAPGSVHTLDQVTRTLPAENVTGALPAAGNTRGQGPADQITGLLGGMPAKNLPTRSVQVNGMPLG
ncbi:ATP-binding protein [Streptomyces sp. NPDC093586]|uniref:ATP-binding protein n=1 Tax=Streptomyces sp. NPDC093586 TaxID=3366042 RepID=UPI00381DF099